MNFSLTHELHILLIFQTLEGFPDTFLLVISISFQFRKTIYFKFSTVCDQTNAKTENSQKGEANEPQ